MRLAGNRPRQNWWKPARTDISLMGMSICVFLPFIVILALFAFGGGV
jgi:hypothetical protein